MSEIITPRTVSGFVELLPGAQLQFERMKKTLERVYESFGFLPFDTPVMEPGEILLAKGGGETDKQIYSVSNANGGSDYAMRFDLTVPLARYVAQHYGELAFPFRRYHIGRVYRGERPQRGRFREFYQADIDVVGDGELDVINDAEMPAIIYKIFTEWGLTRFRIRINNRKLLTGFYEILGLGDKAAEIMRAADKLEKIGADKVRDILVDDVGVPSDRAEEILAFMASSSGSTDDTLAALESRRGKDVLYDEGLDELSAVVDGVRAFGVPDENFLIDLTISRGLDYYTGTVYETQLIDYPEIGSPCSGGRYDNLASHYTKQKLPGVGISVGLSRLFWALCDMGLVDTDARKSGCDVLIMPMVDSPKSAIEAANAMHAVGLSAQLYFEKKKFKAKMNYANRLGVPFVVIIGEDEEAAGEVSLKDMRSGEQQRMKAADAAKFVRDTLAGEATPPLIIEK